MSRVETRFNFPLNYVKIPQLGEELLHEDLALGKQSEICLSIPNKIFVAALFSEENIAEAGDLSSSQHT